MPASSEFVKLCRSQVAIAVSLGATFSAVYLTQELVEGTEAKLIPIAVYPETSVESEENQGLRLQSSESSTLKQVPLLGPPTVAAHKSTVEAILFEGFPSDRFTTLTRRNRFLVLTAVPIGAKARRICGSSAGKL